ncbi:homoserine O-succinyltransferase [Clostridium sp. M62/1]|uniref:homoserine O-succinyltransferase n=1 Tax=Clostridium sp. M62/1 TaxID=411486 RepID=UPI001F6059D2|nr:homoserine O-succinyltransferase [Clostridium sp. M62/1]
MKSRYKWGKNGVEGKNMGVVKVEIPVNTSNVANTLYTNWLNFYVYQVTPYLLSED